MLPCTLSLTGLGSLCGTLSAGLVVATLGTLPAFAGTASIACTGARGSVLCSAAWGQGGNFPRIVQVAPAVDEAERAASDERFRLWVDRCQPVVRQDRHGVGRYFYAAAGCEFGRIHD